MKPNLIIVILFVIIIIAVGAAGAVLYSQVSSATSSYSTLYSDYKTLNTTYSNLLSNYTKLYSEYLTLYKNYLELESNYTYAVTDHNDLLNITNIQKGIATAWEAIEYLQSGNINELEGLLYSNTTGFLSEGKLNGTFTSKDIGAMFSEFFAYPEIAGSFPEVYVTQGGNVIIATVLFEYHDINTTGTVVNSYGEIQLSLIQVSQGVWKINHVYIYNMLNSSTFPLAQAGFSYLEGITDLDVGKVNQYIIGAIPSYVYIGFSSYAGNYTPTKFDSLLSTVKSFTITPYYFNITPTSSGLKMIYYANVSINSQTYTAEITLNVVLLPDGLPEITSTIMSTISYSTIQSNLESIFS